MTLSFNCFAISMSDTCDTDRFKADYGKVAGSFKGAEEKYLKIATDLHCYPKGNGKCKHNELVQTTADFQLKIRELAAKYEFATIAYGNCYPELVGIQDTPFNKK